MARTKEFDEDAVLDQAVELFRRRGFKHTSFADLTAELGVGRQSLYDTYGDKQALYRIVLSRYLDRGVDLIRRRLAGPEPVRQRLTVLFDEMLSVQYDKDQAGCLMVNSMIELSPHDADTRALAQRHAREIEQLFASALGAAQRRGELGPERDPVALARFLYHTMLGLSVACRSLGERDSLRETVRAALLALG